MARAAAEEASGGNRAACDPKGSQAARFSAARGAVRGRPSIAVRRRPPRRCAGSARRPPRRGRSRAAPRAAARRGPAARSRAGR